MKKNFLRIALITVAVILVGCNKENQETPVVLTVTTDEVTEILDVTATGGGNVTSTTANANVTEKGVCWSTVENPTTEDSKTNDGTGLGEFKSSITGLTGGETYYVRAYAVCQGKTTYGNQVTFTAGILPAAVTTSEVTEIAGESAKAGGVFAGKGTYDIVEVGVCWNTTGNPTLEDSYVSVDTPSVGSAFSVDMTYLSFVTTYYVRAFAKADKAVYYGDQVSFTTIAEETVEMPDANFKAFMLNNFDTNKDGALQLGEAEDITEINLSGLCNITDITGVRSCTNLMKLFVGTTEPALTEAGTFNTLSSIDVSGLAFLEEMWLTHTGISSLNTTGCTSLHTMHALQNNLTSLDLSTNTALKELHLNENHGLTALDLSKQSNLLNLGLILTSVSSLDLHGNTSILNVYGEASKLTTLNFSGCSSLLGVYVNNNLITSIDLTGCTSLQQLHAVGNQLPTVNLNDCVNLQHMHLNENPVVSLDLKNNPNLVNLGIINTQLTSLDLSGKTTFLGLWGEGSRLETLNLSGCSKLTEVYINNNLISNLNLSGCSSIIQLHAVGNRLTGIDLKDCVSIEQMHLNENQITSIDVSKQTRLMNFGLINNRVASVDLSNHTSLVGFWGAGNGMTSLNVSGDTALDYLEITNNPELAAITGVSSCSNMTQLKCEITGISSLPLTNQPKLWLLWAHSCPNMASVDLSGCPVLTDVFLSVNASLVTIDISKCAFTMNYLHAHESPKLEKIIMKTGQTILGDFLYNPSVVIERVN